MMVLFISSSLIEGEDHFSCCGTYAAIYCYNTDLDHGEIHQGNYISGSAPHSFTILHWSREVWTSGMQ